MNKQTKRILKNLRLEKPEEAEKTEDTVERYKTFLIKNISLPCILTGMEDFIWEERYILGGDDPEEYEELKKTNPSYTDHFELIEIERECDEQIFVTVRRVSDKKKFSIELDWLKAVDKKSKNHELLNDYSSWFVNF